jgi:S1-C subfamily serine protease
LIATPCRWPRATYASRFGGSIEVPGKVVYVHPLHNLAVVAFEPKTLDGTPIRAVTFDTSELRAGEAVTAVGLGGDSQLRSIATTIASVDDVDFPLSRTLQFRDANLEVASLVNPPTGFDGVLVGKDGRVRALWSSFATEGPRDTVQVSRGMPADLVLEAVEAARETSRSIRWKRSSKRSRSRPRASSACRPRGPNDSRRAIQPTGRCWRLARVGAGTPRRELLHEGDLLLAVNGKTLNRFREVELATQAPSAKVTVLRDGGEQTFDVGTIAMRGEDIDRLLLWAGAVLHAPHRAMSIQRSIPPEGVFVAYFAYGSPATRYKLFAGRRIVAVDGRPTPNLDVFIEAVKGRENRSSLRLQTVTWNGTVDVITLKLDQDYWPTYELRRTSAGWERKSIQ